MNRWIQLLTILLMIALGNGLGQAATITVDTLSDVIDNTNGDCTLREAITAANTDAVRDNCAAGSGEDTIVFAGGVTGTVTLSAQLPDIWSDMSITGPGRDLLTISGADSYRIMDISNVSVTIRDVTLANGYTTQNGAAIRVSMFLDVIPNLVLQDCRITNNVADSGAGGISSWRASLSIQGCEISHNSGFNGGGISSFLQMGDVATFSIVNSIISHNTAQQSGGGIHSYTEDAGQAQIQQSTINNNQAIAGGGIGGGGIYSGGPIQIEDSVIESNTSEHGGAILFWNSNSFYQANISRSLIRNNSATRGGGIYNGNADLYVVDSTLNSNTGGALTNFASTTITNTTISGHSNGTVISYCCGDHGIEKQTIIKNSTIADNEAPVFDVREGILQLYASIISINAGWDCGFIIQDVVFTDLGWNIDSDNTCPLTEATSQSGVDPLLGPLQDNGGYSVGVPGSQVTLPTHALLTFSPAIDNGDNTDCPATDQRGIARPADGDVNGSSVCDIGAYEHNPGPQPGIVFLDSIAPEDDRDMPFGDVLAGSSAEYAFTMANEGSQTLLIQDISLTNTPIFSLNINGGSNPCLIDANITLAAGESCTMSIIFAPDTTGPQLAEMTIGSNDPDESLLVVSLSGLGSNPVIEPDPVDYVFSLTNVGSSNNQAMTLNNTGVGTLSISAISVLGTNANQFMFDPESGSSPCGAIPFSIDEGESCTVSLIYAPTSAGSHTAQLQIISNDPIASQLDLPLTGEGNSLPQFTAGTGSFKIAENVSIGTLVTTVIGNDADGDTPAYSITGGNNANRFAIDSVTGELTVIAGLDYETTQSYQLTITINDGRGGSNAADVTINVTDVDDTQDVNQGGGGGGGCAVRSGAQFDPVLTLLILFSVIYLIYRRTSVSPEFVDRR